MHSRSRIVRNQEWDPTLSELNTLDLAKLELGLLGLDTVDGETALGVVDETEVLASLLEGDDIHETSGVGRVSADLAVDLDETLHQDGLDLATVEGVLQTIFRPGMSVDLFRISLSSNIISGVVSYRLRMKTIKGRQSRSL